MRFLVVYQDFAKSTQELIERLGVEDVRTLLVRKGEREASAEFLKALKAHPNAPTAVCHVIRTFTRSIEEVLDIQYVAKKFRLDDQQLAKWLLPVDAPKESFAAPSDALAAAVQRAEHLVVANGALDHANEIAGHRWRFVNRSADLLARYANGEDLGPLRTWKQKHGVDFAVNGGVRYEYLISANGADVEGNTEWHLKEGDKTTRESAARIYFERVEIGGNVKVCVFYVGPHPRAGIYTVCVDCGDGLRARRP